VKRLLVALGALALLAPFAASELQARNAVSCGAPSRLGSNGFPRVGPLLFGFYNYPANTTGRAHSTFTPGYPTKVVLQLKPHRPLQTRLILQGWNCSTGKRLRFWYDRGALPFSLPAATEQFERTGALVQVLRTDRKAGFHGYMLFTQPGRWKVTVRKPGVTLGSVVVAVG
jgi:hypothetical protein